MNSNDIFRELMHCPTSIIEHGFRLEEKPADDMFPNGMFLIYRNVDDKLIGRVHFQNNEWNARYWFFGGGTSSGPFATKWIGALWVMVKNSNLDEGWDL